MKDEVKKKVKFITFWFNSEKDRLSYAEQKQLLDSWISVLIESEEYEMASALRDEKKKIISEKVDKRRRSRSLFQKIKYYFIKFKRKIRDFRNKQLR